MSEEQAPTPRLADEGTTPAAPRRLPWLAAAAALLLAAVQAMPVRQDPDAPVVPDHL